MGDDPIAGLKSFDDHRNDKDKPLQVPLDSDSSEGSNGEATPITYSRPSITQPAMFK